MTGRPDHPGPVQGRIFDETLPLLKAAGIEVLDDPRSRAS
jgi:hypothetical protein